MRPRQSSLGILQTPAMQRHEAMTGIYLRPRFNEAEAIKPRNLATAGATCIRS